MATLVKKTTVVNDGVVWSEDGDGNYFYGTSGHDTYTGTAYADTMFGGAGNDRLFGRDGNDTLNGGRGTDLLDGGSGIDTASYVDSAAGVTVTLGGDFNGSAQDGWGQTDTLVSIENVFGSAFADKITGDRFANVLRGGGGNDWISPGLGSDIIDGGAGQDQVSYYGGPRISVDLAAGTASGINYEVDTLISIEDVSGTEYGDWLGGSNGNNVLFGAQGDDTFHGRGGDDILNAGTGSDKMWGDDDGGPKGRDTFILDGQTRLAGDVDMIVDFQDGFDTIVMARFGGNTSITIGQFRFGDPNGEFIIETRGSDAGRGVLFDRATSKLFLYNDIVGPDGHHTVTGLEQIGMILGDRVGADDFLFV